MAPDPSEAGIDPDNHRLEGEQHVIQSDDRKGEPIIAFNVRWVSTSIAKAQAVESALVETLAGICSATAGRIATASSTDLATVKGYENRAGRGRTLHRRHGRYPKCGRAS